jgi:allophanate hydrolase subunit 2
MAYLLEGGHISLPEIISAPVQPGTVQITPSGNCIVLMRDAQTTGGYARIGQLPEESISQLAQKRAGEEIILQMRKS